MNSYHRIALLPNQRVVTLGKFTADVKTSTDISEGQFRESILHAGRDRNKVLHLVLELLIINRCYRRENKLFVIVFPPFMKTKLHWMIKPPRISESISWT